MIIPVRCFTCGKVLADKWRRYQELSLSVGDVDEAVLDRGATGGGGGEEGGGGAKKKKSQTKANTKTNTKTNPDNDAVASTQHPQQHSIYFDKGHKGAILDSLGIVKICCRRHMLTHVDLVDIL